MSVCVCLSRSVGSLPRLCSMLISVDFGFLKVWANIWAVIFQKVIFGFLWAFLGILEIFRMIFENFFLT